MTSPNALPDGLYHRGPCCGCEDCGGEQCYVLHNDRPDEREHHFCIGCHAWIVDFIRDAEEEDPCPR